MILNWNVQYSPFSRRKAQITSLCSRWTKTGESDDGQVYLYRFIDNGEDEEPGLENIEDDDEFERASEAFNDWMESQDFGDIDLDDIE